MKINELTLLEEAFARSFGFMLNRIWEIYGLEGDPHDDEHPRKRDAAEDRCFTEFVAALEEMGVGLEDITACTCKEDYECEAHRG